MRRMISPTRPRRTASGLSRTSVRWVMARPYKASARRTTSAGTGPDESASGTGSPTTRRSGMCAAPDPGLDVLGLVDRAAGARLHRRLVERDGEHRGGGQLLAGVRPQRRRAPRDHVVDDQVQRVRALGVVLDQPGRADHDGRAVVHRVVERRAPGDQPVELGDGDADGGVGGGAQPAGGDRAVHVERAVLVRPVEVDGERGRQHQRVALPVLARFTPRCATRASASSRCSSVRSSTIRLRPRPTVVRGVGESEVQWSRD